MPSEIANAIFITFVATEYLQQSSSETFNNSGGLRRVLKSSSVRIAFVLVTLINVAEQLHINYRGAETVATDAVERLFHLPRVSFAAIAYIMVLYWDCKRCAGSNLSKKEYVKRVGAAFMRVAPVYPFLAVLISCLFMFIISALEALHLNVDILNWPIYYGVLYGPFSAVYWSVKSRVVKDFRYALPTSEPGRSTGHATDTNTTSYQAWLRERHSIPNDATF